MSVRKVCVVTGSRSDYSHLYWLMKRIKEDRALELQIIVTGMHLSFRFGSTFKIIENDGFKISEKVNILRHPDSEVGTIKTIGLGCHLFADALHKLQSDIVVVFGDRFEMLSAAIAAYVMKIPLAHIHGGETSQGAIDEAIRHSITKMANIHFAAAERYRQRIVQLGEHPRRVFNFGAPGLEAIQHLKLLDKKQLARLLDFNLDGQAALATYHPVTLEKETPIQQIKNILNVIQQFHFKVIFTLANADPHGQIINQEIKKFCRGNEEKYKFISNLGQIRYLSCLKNFDLIIGNSSSGLVEAPSFRIPVVNIGDRQKGRLKASNIIDVGYRQGQIKRGIELALSKEFKEKIKNVKNPYVRYKDANINYRIKEKIKNLKTDEDLFKKEFYDIHFKIGRS